jgi:hypothetical protein
MDNVELVLAKVFVIVILMGVIDSLVPYLVDFTEQERKVSRSLLTTFVIGLIVGGILL